jgi:uncharacterized iron-regulated membrane protein
MKFRKILFWLHLSTGSVMGIVILIMSVTGFLLAFERQIKVWADREYRFVEIPVIAKRLPFDTLLKRVQRSEGSQPTDVAVHPQPNASFEFSFGRERTIYVNPYSGVVLGSSSSAVRAFFGAVEKWHRALGQELRKPGWGRMLTGACNLGFLFLVSSGFFLWWPKKWTWHRVRSALLFQRGLAGRARDWSWHTVTGIWCAAPLFLIVLTGAVMSYQWINNLLYTLSRSPLPTAGQRLSGPSRPGEPSAKTQNPKNLDMLFAIAEKQIPQWETISLRLTGSARDTLTFSIDSGNGGQPNKRSQLSLDEKTGQVLRWEPFSSYSLGRRLRAWARFVHTGEAGGITGQLIAAVASLGASFLVWTGLSLAIRRLQRALTRRPKAAQAVNVESSELVSPALK